MPETYLNTVFKGKNMLKYKDIWTRYAYPRFFLKFRGVYDKDKLYYAIIDWFARRKWEYEEEMLEHGEGPFGIEDGINIFGIKRTDEWVQFRIDLETHSFDEKRMTIKTEGGEDKNVVNGRIRIFFHGAMTMDYENGGKWDKSTLHAAMKDFYNKYIFRRRLAEKYFDQLWYEMYDLHYHLKNVLGMQAKGHEQKFYTGVRRG